MAKLVDVKHYVDWMQASVVEATEKPSKQFLYNLWDEIVLNTPVRTGLARFSWRMAPSTKGTYKPTLLEGEGELYDSETGQFAGFSRVFPDPARPNLEKYKRIYKKFVLYNNQDYIVKLNEDETKYYYQFIDDGIARAIFKTNYETKVK